MKVVVDSEPVGEAAARGRAVDLRDYDGARDVSPTDLVAAMHGDGPEKLRIDCPAPSDAHRTLAVPNAPKADSLRALLAVTARSRGETAPQREELAAVRRRLRNVDPDPIDLRSARRRVAEAGTRETDLRERVAALRGRTNALRERDDATAEAVESVESELREAAALLSEVETERIAAEQALSRAREVAREARVERDRKLRLEDREANLERAARDHLARSVYDEFADAIVRIPGDATPGSTPGEYDGDRTAAWQAAVRLADLDAPVVVTGTRFESAAAATAGLDTPVVRL